MHTKTKQFNSDSTVYFALTSPRQNTMEATLVIVWAVVGMITYVCYEWLVSMSGKSIDCIPRPIAFPIIGHPFHLLFTNYSSSTWLSNRLGGTYMLKLFHQGFVFVTTWADMKETMVAQSEIFSGKPEPTKNDMLGFTFLFLDGPLWKEKRRFTLHHLRNFGFGKKHMENTISEEFCRVIAVLDGQRTFGFNNFFFCPFLNVLWGIMAGKTYEFGNEELTRVSQAIKGTLASGKKNMIISIFPFLKYLPGDPLRTEETRQHLKTVQDFIQSQIDEHEKSLGAGEPRDYMDAYLTEIKNRAEIEYARDTECYDKRHLLGAIYDILQAGVETTATTLEWSLLYMATWPEIQRKAQDELDTVIGRSRRTVFSDHPMLPYVKATLMEVQRFCTVVPICSPRMTKRITKVNGRIIPEGTIVLQNLYAIHREKKLWGDPEAFRPERFLIANGKADKTEGWIPFSLGPRMCLGESLARMELFLYFTGLLQRYSFRCVPDKPPPSLVPIAALTLQPRPFHLVIEKR